jgi:glycosyltransferase involved in cell wall biosynthesis
MNKLAIFISHPVFYQVPLYQKLNQKVNLTVYYYSKFGAERYFDPQFKKEFKWDINLLEGYNYKFLKNYSFKPGFHFFGFINFGIFKEIFKNKFDAILINSWSYLSDWLVILACLISKTKLLLRVESPYNQEILKSKWKLFIKKIIFGKILFPKVHTFLYIGEENRKFYKFYGVPDEKLFFAPYAVDNERFQKEYERLKDKKEELRKELGIEPDDIVILFVGKLIPKKRPMDLLKAYESILGTSDVPSIDGNILTSDIHLLYVGDGELRLNLEKYTKEHNLKNVHFVGFKNQTEISKYYAMSDIFVLPSDVGETWGLVVNEAMNFRLPVIVSDLVGCGSDLVKHGENGYIFKTGNIEELARYLEELIINEEKRKLFGEKSFEIVKGYNYDKTVESILKIVNK